MDTAISVLLGLVIHCGTGGVVEMDRLAADLVHRDVVFLGEVHDNDAGHAMQLAVVEALHRQRPDVVISMEMFERDAQGVLDDYLRGRMDEATFKKHSRPWPNYDQHYRPIVEFAKAKGLDVVAANAPRRAARGTAQGQATSSPWVARSTTADKNRYWDLFQVAMKEHPGEVSDQAMTRMYEAQCLKDDTMAESIVDYLEGHPHRRPLVVHLCGHFHSDYGLGTVERLLSRRPLTQVSVISTVATEEPAKKDVTADRSRAHYLFVVPVPPKSEDVVADDGKPETTAPATVAEEAPSGERGALGFMPDYGSDKVRVSGVTPDGPADQAGIREGDIILEIGTERVPTLDAYMDVMEGLRAGQKVPVTVERDGVRKVFDVTLGARRR